MGLDTSYSNISEVLSLLQKYIKKMVTLFMLTLWYLQTLHLKMQHKLVSRNGPIIVYKRGRVTIPYKKRQLKIIVDVTVAE